MFSINDIYFILNRKIKNLEKKIKDAGYARVDDLNNNVISITANQPFPDSWHTSGHLSDLISDINRDSTATKGKIYLSTVSFDDLPSGMMQAEMKVEMMSNGNSSGKIMLFTITSEDVSPYHWEATSAYGRNATWRSFVNN